MKWFQKKLYLKINENEIKFDFYFSSALEWCRIALKTNEIKKVINCYILNVCH
jgi:hypothetical protein